MKNKVSQMKTKLLAVIFVSLALVGCGGGNNEAKAEQPEYWTEVARQNIKASGISEYSLITMLDVNGNVIVLTQAHNGITAIQIINDKPMPPTVTKCKCGGVL